MAKAVERKVRGLPTFDFSSGPVNAVRLSLVSVPWSEGDEKWISELRH